jgi:FAD/FMN-containing dehydrogenase
MNDVHRPGDPRYDELRRPLNPSLDPRPAMVVEALRAADVQAAVRAARGRDLPVAVQATGHGARESYRGGVLVNTSAMSTVLVDPDRRLARVGPGATWAQVLAAASPFGLAPLSGSSPSVGVTGFTLGGGVGWLSRKHGFAADSVVRAEVVTATGDLVSTGPDEHPDLFWALRGGGGSLGLVTTLEFRLHPVARVYAGTSYFPVERAAQTLARYRQWVDEAPDELSTAVLLTRLADSAEGPAARHLDLLGELSDPVIDFLVEAGRDEGLGISTIEIRHWGGAMADPGPGAGPVGHRDVPFSVIADSAGPALVETLRPHATGGSFLNFLSDTGRTESAYTPADFRRLREVKAAYDPDSVFSRGHSIPPLTRRTPVRDRPDRYRDARRA